MIRMSVEDELHQSISFSLCGPVRLETTHERLQDRVSIQHKKPAGEKNFSPSTQTKAA